MDRVDLAQIAMSLRAFIPPNPTLSASSSVTLCVDESHYLVRVRRAKVGTRCELMDRQGQRYLAQVTHPDPKACTLDIDAVVPPLPATPELELWLGMPDATAQLAALARATELGASCVRLIQCRFAQGRRPSAPRIARCLDASMRQCGRPSAPLVTGPMDLEAALAQAWEGLSWLACPTGPNRGTNGPAQAQRVAIGPEGGFSPQEQEALIAAGFQALRLGPFVLRSEVAVTAALAQLQ